MDSLTKSRLTVGHAPHGVVVGLIRRMLSEKELKELRELKERSAVP